MNKIILPCTTTTGWAGSTGVALSTVDAELLSNNLPSSLDVHFPAVVDSFVEHQFSSPVSLLDADGLTLYTELVFHCVSRSKGGYQFRYSTDFVYRVELTDSLGVVTGFYLPVTRGWDDVSLNLSGIKDISKIKIIDMTGEEDYLTVSCFMLSVQEFPLDIFIGFREQIELIKGKSPKILIGTSSVSVGDASLSFSIDVPYIDQSACIELVDGTGKTEVHHIDSKTGLTVAFSDLFDGKVITVCEGSVTVYLYVPVLYGVTQKEIILPAISLWSMEPENKLHTSGLNKRVSKFGTDGTFLETQEGIYQNYTVTIDCESRQTEVLAFLTYIVRKFIGNKIAWVNGRLVYLIFDSPPKEILPTESFNVIPKVEYTCSVEVKEDVYEDIKSSPMTTLNITINQQEA